MEKVRAKVKISGRVQGVFYRFSTQEQAKMLGLTGWVKNNSDGTVEALFEGPKDKVEEILKWCKKGPPGALVSDVSVDWETFSGEFNDFKIVY